jgi:heterodisulfide reductase subunit A
LNKYLFEMVNIRDQCSWVHMREKGAATEKAKDLIRMAVAKSRLLQPLREDKLSITPNALIIGGGISGMTAALNIANQGFKVYIIEKEEKLGGILNDLNILYPIHEEASTFLNQIIQKVEETKKILIFLKSRIENVKGYIGNYEVSIADSKNEIHNLKIGTIIVATGAQELKPDESFQYKRSNKNVLTQLELEKRLKQKDAKWLEKIKRITVILCVNARQKEGITYCSNICCGISIKNISILKELKPNLEIIVLYRDLQMAKKEFEEYYRERRKDAIFLKYRPEKMPEITKLKEKVENYKIKIFDWNLKESIEFKTEIIVLATPMIPSDNVEDLAKMLKVPIDKNGFFLEAHVKLRPLDFATDGIFLCGCAQWPKNIQDSISQANGAAGRASRFLSSKEIKTSGLVAEVNSKKCIGCGKCYEVCPYNAIEIIEFERKFEDVDLIFKKSFINSALCKGCGTCAATCPIRAISVKSYDLKQIGAMIEAYLLENIP